MADASTAIGLDIDEKSVKFAKIRQTNGEVTLLKCAVRDIPKEQPREKAVSDILKELFKGEKPDVRVYTSAFGPNIALKRISLPLMPDSEMSEAIRWEAKNTTPFPIENAVIGFTRAGKAPDKTADKNDVIFVVAGDELVNFFNTVSKEAGIRIAGLSAVPFALGALAASQKKFEQDKVTALIDIGAEAASINLFKGAVLQFTREISVAGDSFTKSMTGLMVADHWQLNLTHEQAEDIKKKYGIPARDTSEVTENGIPLMHIYEMMSPTLRRMQNEILRSFDYFKEQFHEEKVDKIYLAGGSASLKNLDEYLSTSLGVNAERINPLLNVKIDQKSGITESELRDIGPRLSLAIGLALDRGKSLNLLLTKEKAQGFALPSGLGDIFKALKLPPIQVNLPSSALFWVAVPLIVAALSYNYYLVRERNHYREELLSKQALLTDIKSLVERKAILNQIQKEGSRVKENLYYLTQVLPAGVALSDLTYDNKLRLVWLSGEAPDHGTVGKLVRNIEASPYFSDTKLLEARESGAQENAIIIFRVSFKIS